MYVKTKRDWFAPDQQLYEAGIVHPVPDNIGQQAPSDAKRYHAKHDKAGNISEIIEVNTAGQTIAVHANFTEEIAAA